MKKKALPILIVCAVLVLGAIAAAIIVPQVYVPHAGAYAAQFQSSRADFDAAAAYMKTLTKKDPAAAVTVSIPTMGADDTIYFFRDNEKQRVVTLTVKPEDRAHLDAVARAFAAIGFEFKSARVEGENVTFTAVEDAYSVLFVPADEKPDAPEGWKVKKLDTGWYQMIKTEK